MTTVRMTSSLIVLMWLAGCAGSAPSPEQRQALEQAKEEAIEDILNTPLAAEDYNTEDSRCLSSHEYRSVDVLDDQHVVFRGSGERLWMNQLRTRCVGLRQDEVLRFEMRSNRVCDMDTFQSLDQGLGFIRASGTCTLGTFTPITPEQLEAIELAVKESRKAPPASDD